MIKIGLLVSGIKFCTPRKIFKYFKTRYNQDVINGLNNIHKIRNKMVTVRLRLSFLQPCLNSRVCPSFVSFRIKRANL